MVAIETIGHPSVVLSDRVHGQLEGAGAIDPVPLLRVPEVKEELPVVPKALQGIAEGQHQLQAILAGTERDGSRHFGRLRCGAGVGYLEDPGLLQAQHLPRGLQPVVAEDFSVTDIEVQANAGPRVDPEDVVTGNHRDGARVIADLGGVAVVFGGAGVP